MNIVLDRVGRGCQQVLQCQLQEIAFKYLRIEKMKCVRYVADREEQLLGKEILIWNKREFLVKDRPHTTRPIEIPNLRRSLHPEKCLPYFPRTNCRPQS